MGPSWLQIALVVLLLVLLFGRGRISALMGDVARGIKSFRRGLRDDDGDDSVLEDSKSDDASDGDGASHSDSDERL